MDRIEFGAELDGTQRRIHRPIDAASFRCVLSFYHRWTRRACAAVSSSRSAGLSRHENHSGGSGDASWPRIAIFVHCDRRDRVLHDRCRAASEDNVEHLPTGSAEAHAHFTTSATAIEFLALFGAFVAFYAA